MNLNCNGQGRLINVKHDARCIIISHHQCVDDTQLFHAIKASSTSTDLAKLESCSQAVKGWFAVNNLMLNADKSDVMFIGT